jgi:hypothetical protein
MSLNNRWRVRERKGGADRQAGQQSGIFKVRLGLGGIVRKRVEAEIHRDRET